MRDCHISLASFDLILAYGSVNEVTSTIFTDKIAETFQGLLNGKDYTAVLFGKASEILQVS